MLRINQQSNAAAAKSYYASPAEYYGAGEQEMVGAWGGKAADRLGLDGDVLQYQFERLCDNRHPFTGDRLTARMRADRRVGYDFNFHAPKSVSLLYALADDPAVLDAFRQAMNSVMTEMEAGVKVRVRKRGQMAERTAGNLVYGEFVHFTARPVKGEIDPHLHGHCFVPNVCWDSVENVWKAIDVASVKENAPRWQALFQNRLGRRLEELGYAVEWNGDAFEVAGIHRAMIDRFSRRTHQIDQAAEKRGITDAAAKAELGAMTRERKRKDAALPQLRAHWRQRMTGDDRAALAQASLRRRPGYDGDRPQPLNQLRRRQRLTAHEGARAANAPTGPATPRQNHGHGR